VTWRSNTMPPATSSWSLNSVKSCASQNAESSWIESLCGILSAHLFFHWTRHRFSLVVIARAVTGCPLSSGSVNRIAGRHPTRLRGMAPETATKRLIVKICVGQLITEGAKTYGILSRAMVKRPQPN
jgi:hypothetical protein